MALFHTMETFHRCKLLFLKSRLHVLSMHMCYIHLHSCYKYLWHMSNVRSLDHTLQPHAFLVLPASHSCIPCVALHSAYLAACGISVYTWPRSVKNAEACINSHTGLLSHLHHLYHSILSVIKKTAIGQTKPDGFWGVSHTYHKRYKSDLYSWSDQQKPVLNPTYYLWAT